MNIEEIETFLTIAKTHNLSNAAQSLKLSQTAITHRLKNLEEELGMVLFDRGRGIKNVYITPSGENFFIIAQQWKSLQEEIEKFKTKGEQYSLSLGSVQILNDIFFPPLFKKLLNHSPKINLSVHTEHSSEMFFLVEQRIIDIAIGWKSVSLPDLQCFAWKTVPLICLYWSEVPQKPSIISVDQLDVKKELYITWPEEFKEWHDSYFPPAQYKPIYITGASLALQLLKNSDYWVIVPLWLANYAINHMDKRYSYYILSDSPEALTAYVITHKYPRPSVKKSLDIFFEYFNKIDMMHL